MIVTVTPNAAVDKTYCVEHFTLDRVNRPSREQTVAGGKGVNVARVYRTLGGTAVATGFLGGIQGRMLAQALSREGMPEAFVRIREETRLCIAVIDPVHGTQTEVNEQGPRVTARQCHALKKRVQQLLSQYRPSCVVLSGSLPPGAPHTLYAELIELARRNGTRAVLDSSGMALHAGLQARPWMVKPNRAEAEALLQQPVRTLEQAREAAQKLCELGVEIVALTLGAEGALLRTREGIWWSVPPAITFASAVASGDAFVAAFLWEWFHGNCPGDVVSALRLATGAGAANAAVIGAGFCTRDAIYAMAQRVQLDPI